MTNELSTGIDMTDTEYENERQRIIQEHGEPLFDMHEPQNESAKLLRRLMYRKGYETRKAKGQTKLGKLADEVKGLDLGPLTIPELDLNENDLLAFTEVEKKVLRDYFSNLKQSYKTLATRHNVPYQRITSLFASDSFKVLYKKVFDCILPLDALISIRALIKKGDSKVALEVARHYGLIKNEALDLDVNSAKPIEDTKLIEFLKTLGDNHKGS